MITTNKDVLAHLYVEIERCTDTEQIKQLRVAIHNLESTIFEQEGEKLMVRYENIFKQEQPKPDVSTGKVIEVTIEQPAEIFTEQELREKYKSELILLCEDMELDSKGTKGELISRIIETFSK